MRCSQMTNDSILSDTLKVDVHTYEVNWVAYTGGGFFLTRKDFTMSVWRWNVSNLPQLTQRIIIIIIIIIFINPLTARVAGAPQMIWQPVFSIFPCSPLPSGTWRTPACPFPDVAFPPLPLSALSSLPFHCALEDGFGQT